MGRAFILAEVIVAPGGFLILGNVISGVPHTNLGWPTWTWAPFGVAAAVMTWYLVYRGVRLSTSAGVILGTFELLVFLALAITLIAAAGPHNTLSVFGVHTGNAKGWGSVIPGVLAWMVLGCILLGYFMIRDRSRIAETRRVFTGQTPDEREAA